MNKLSYIDYDIKMEYQIPRILHLKEFGYSFPSHMILGLVTYCDQFCKSCYAGGYRFNPNIHLTASLDVLKNVLRKAARFGRQYNGKHPYYSDKTLGLKALTLVGSGEPLLYPYLKELVDFAHKEAGLEIGLYTNGNNLRDGIIRPGIDTVPQDIATIVLENFRFVRISLDAASPETHAKERGVKGQFKRIIESVADLVERRNSLGCRDPSIGVQFTVDDDNIQEIEKVAKLAKRMGVNYLAYKPKYVPWHIRKERMTNLSFKDVEKQLIKSLSYADDNFYVHGKFDQFLTAWGPDYYNTGQNYTVCRNVWLSAYLDIDVDSVDKKQADLRAFICANKNKEDRSADGKFLWSEGPITSTVDFEDFWIKRMPKLINRIDINKCISGCKNDPFNRIIENKIKLNTGKLCSSIRDIDVAPEELHVMYI